MTQPPNPWQAFADDINAAMRKRHQDMRPCDAMAIFLDFAGAIVRCAPLEAQGGLFADALRRLSEAAGMVPTQDNDDEPPTTGTIQ